MQTLDPYKIPLKSINLIEASAGTGKSWTVTFLYLRLLLEREPALTVDQILVVTFTDAATKELREDVRNRLVEAQAAFENPEQDQVKTEYSELIRTVSDHQEAIRRIRRARLCLDEAAIFTIHGFCQRVLTEHAFEAGLPFESELLEDDSELMQSLADDYWRRTFERAPEALLFKIQQQRITPDSLLSDIRMAIGKPYLKICGPENEPPGAEQWMRLEDSFQQAMTTWANQQASVIQILLTHEGLNQRSYKKEQLIELFNLMNSLLPNVSSFTSQHKVLVKLGEAKISLAAKKGHEPPQHPFFKQWQVFLDLWNALDSGSDDYMTQVRIHLLEYLKQELPKEKQRLGLLSFDDLLLQLEKSLTNNPQLVSALREKYQVALIDEFQDTDPIQYKIFKRIYRVQDPGEADVMADVAPVSNNKNALFLVGDPKQAIYSFRGGDIYTYLKAKKDSNKKNHYTLKTNWRSHPDLIEALNGVYALADNPFQDPSIAYVKVNAGGKIDADLVTPDKRRPLRFWQYQTQKDEKGKSLENAEMVRENIAHAVAGDIAELLNAGVEGEASIADKPLSGGDIAILVRSHAQGRLMKNALNEKGIASVQSSRESIFDTHEAHELQYLLTAIVEPQREAYVRRALVTDMMGLVAEDLLAFETDSAAWEEQIESVYSWHQQWKKKGFLPMMRSLMISMGIYRRLLKFVDGERRLTNLVHLSELIHRESHLHSLGAEDVLRWLRQQQDNPVAASSDRELRLESDENLVKIVTIHKSKGLEYPIVYCPFVGLGGGPPKDKYFTFHEDGKTFLEIGSPNAADHKKIKNSEERAENARLLYVALTRAKYQCTLVCFPEKNGGSDNKSALDWLLGNGKQRISGNSKVVNENNEQFYHAYQNNLQKLAKNKNISLAGLPQFDGHLRYQKPEIRSELCARHFTTTLGPPLSITSFSGLTYGLHEENPDHDGPFTRLGFDIDREQLNIHPDNNFPRGATAGSALHEIYENLDFTHPVMKQQAVVNTMLNKWGFEEKLADAATQLMEDSLSTELFPGFSLGQLPTHKRLNEMEFYLPLQQLKVDKLKQILLRYLPHEGHAEKKWQGVRNAVNTLKFEQVEGFLKGFVDLIFEHKGRYYVVDYKSNSVPDYTPQNLMPVMADSHYYLQYLLYCVALHRYLQQRIADYRWETHMGGVYYLFIRGMSSQTNDNGVFYDKPCFALIEALDGLFSESFI